MKVGTYHQNFIGSKIRSYKYKPNCHFRLLENCFSPNI